MCGIAGIVAARPMPDLPERLSAMERVLVHRGPDDAGAFIARDGRVGVVNRRLAIRDLSPLGHMPMANGAGTVHITYNGELYNAAALRAVLEAKGYAFVSRSDTEVILHGYEAWGSDVVHHLRGMFGFAIYDAGDGTGRRPRLLLARDRTGIKPLYYADTSDAFVFVSELKALRASGLVGRAVSPAGLVAYLLLGSVPNPLTIYDACRALDAGCTAELGIDAPIGSPVIRQYWDVAAIEGLSIDPSDARERVREALADAVGSHLVSDAPLGAFLSGGLDSSAVVALMRTKTQQPIRTCSIAFEDPRYSEAPFARAVAESIGAEHHERIVTQADVRGALDRIFWAMDQPSIDGINAFFVAQTAREAGLKVALSGLGGDELFGGYHNTFVGVPRFMRAKRTVDAVPCGAAVARVVRKAPGRQWRWAKYMDALERPRSRASAYLACRGLFAPSQVRGLVTADIWDAACKEFEATEYIAARVPDAGHETLDWVRRAELALYTRHQLLRDTDVMSMAHSLEVRVPFLDHELISRVVPLRCSLGDETTSKQLLVEAVADLLPASVRERRTKQGFVFPFADWLLGGLGEAVGIHQPDGDLFYRPAVDAVVGAWKRGDLHWTRPWALTVCGRWQASAN
jgi:asparagine synthase (glutamine-hydrolysing)